MRPNRTSDERMRPNRTTDERMKPNWTPDVKKCIFWGYFGGSEGVFNDQTKPILLSSYPFIYIYVHVK